MIIMLHSSKTMRPRPGSGPRLDTPALIDRATELAGYLKSLRPEQLQLLMRISPALAEETHALIADWHTAPDRQVAAVTSFVGDIYSGLRADGFSAADRDHAGRHLRILSGLYGILRPWDGIRPYRLEMGYRLPDTRYANLYRFWGDSIAKQLPDAGLVVNLAAAEYSRAVLPHLDPSRVVTPKFLTRDPKTGKPKFLVVHAKIARGAFARWLIMSRIDTSRIDTSPIDTAAGLGEFSDIGYRFDPALSTPQQPVFVCDEFGGKGLSVRLRA